MNTNDETALLRRRLTYEMSLAAALGASNAVAPFLHLSRCAGLHVEQHGAFFSGTVTAAQGVLRDIKAHYAATWEDPPRATRSMVDDIQLLDERIQAREDDSAAWLQEGIDTMYATNLRLGDWIAWHSPLDAYIVMARELDRQLSSVFSPPCLHVRFPSGRVKCWSPPDGVAPSPLVEFDQWNDEILMDKHLDHIDPRPSNVLLNAISVRAPEVLYLAHWAREIKLQQRNRTLTLSLR